MNWEAIGAVGEIVGALAVFLTLAYLAIQIRQNTKTIRHQNEQARAEFLASIVESSYNSDHMPPILTKIGSDEALNAEEIMRYSMWMIANCKLQDFNLYQVSSGVTRESNTRSIVFFVEFMIAPSRFSRQIWENTKPNYSDEFIKFVDEILDKPTV